MPTPASSHPAPEHWSVDAAASDVAVLTIPASARRDRVFEIDVRVTERTAAEVDEAWHALAVALNGAREWSRRIPTANPGQTDRLDFHGRRRVPLGEALRIRATGRALRQRLLIDVEEALS